MRNKKYRLWNIAIILIVLAIVAFALMLFGFEKWERIIILIIGLLFISFIPLVLIQFLEIQSNQIVVRGTNSLNKSYNRSFKKCIFIFDDIQDIYVEANKIIWICLKDGNNVSVPLGGFLCKKEIISLIYETRAQIKGYEQNY